MGNNIDGTYSTLKNALDLSALKGKLIANNIANVNTENYKRYDINFEESLNKAKNNKSLRKTNDRHLNANDFENVNIERDEITNTKSDGNNVDIDIEKVEQAKNSLMYNTLITRINGKLNTKSYIISGGSN